ncbi:MAG: hypothetical protein EHM14_00585 [Methanothrix sp.]|nr:MAG: hypothetical protein EHM14_00585 [Methanothrix sp.]
MRYLIGPSLRKIAVITLITLALCSLACADNPGYSGDLSGQWNMAANTKYTFNLDLQENGMTITGLMTPTSSVEPADTISGTASPNGTIMFTRERAGQWVQIYSGKVSGSPGSMTMAGTFSQNGQGQYPWSASKKQDSGQGPVWETNGPDDASAEKQAGESSMPPAAEESLQSSAGTLSAMKLSAIPQPFFGMPANSVMYYISNDQSRCYYFVLSKDDPMSEAWFDILKDGVSTQMEMLTYYGLQPDSSVEINGQKTDIYRVKQIDIVNYAS